MIMQVDYTNFKRILTESLTSHIFVKATRGAETNTYNMYTKSGGVMVNCNMTIPTSESLILEDELHGSKVIFVEDIKDIDVKFTLMRE